MVKKNLLSKALRRFAYCILICFLFATPLFYLLAKYFYAEDMMDVIEAVRQGYGVPILDFEQDIITGMMLQYLLIFIAIALALFITMRFVTQKLWRPFDDTLQKVEQFNLAQSEIPDFIKTDICEFTRLNDSLGLLMKKDKETYRIQKEFTENASHELQTPLAVIRCKLDILMQEELTESQMKIISDLYGMTVKMEHLNRNLLLLAKIENAQYSTLEKIDIVSLLTDTISLYNTLQEGVILCVEDYRTDLDKKLCANLVLLECMLKNLIINAIRNSSLNSKVQIQVNDNTIMVCNESIDDAPLDADALFCRFCSGNVRQKGNGLGLAIVKAVCDFHHWLVEYKYEDQKHKFVINFYPSIKYASNIK